MNRRQSYRQKLELERTALVALGLVSERYGHASIAYEVNIRYHKQAK